MKDEDWLKDMLWGVSMAVLVFVIIVVVMASISGCGPAATDAWAITPAPTATKTPTPTPTPTPIPPSVVCSVSVPSDGRQHSIAARVYYLHEEYPCILYHRSIEQPVGPGAFVEVTAEGSPVGADVWLDAIHVKTCGQGDPVFLDGLENGNTNRWKPCATPTPQAYNRPVGNGGIV